MITDDWKTMRQMKRNLGYAALGLSLVATNQDLSWGQQKNNVPVVAPPSAGYGNRPVQGAGQPAQQPVNAQIRPGQSPQSGGVSPQQSAVPGVNAAFNPNSPAGRLAPAGAGNPAVTGVAGGANASVEPIQMRAPFPALNQQEQQYVDQILNYWEQSTKNIEQYSCEFKRWQYDPANQTVAQLQGKTGNSQIPLTTATGVLKYSAPDKGMYRIDRLGKLTGNLLTNNVPEHKEFSEQFGEYWICDGKSVYDYDRTAKVCTRYDMPPQMQGLGIINSPMPFLFGVQAAKLKERYWVRAIAPPLDANGQPRKDLYALEAYPKFSSDAVNYDHVTVVLDQAKFLPLMMIMHNTEWRPDNDAKDVFEFTNREDGKSLLQRITPDFWQKEFIPTDPPKDWKLEIKPYSPPATESIQQAVVPGTPATANGPGPQPGTVPR